jgi:predicted Holliday junction resolvase-like endonuclease
MNLVDTLNGLKAVYAICPCCGDPIRLADADLFTKARPPKTKFDEIEEETSQIETQLERYEASRERIEEGARRRGRDAARQRLAEIAPFFTSRRIVPNDVKVLFDPVDYVVFNGLDAGCCGSVELVDRPPQNAMRERLHWSLERALKEGKIEWQTFHISDDGKVVAKRRKTARESSLGGTSQR